MNKDRKDKWLMWAFDHVIATLKKAWPTLRMHFAKWWIFYLAGAGSVGLVGAQAVIVNAVCNCEEVSVELSKCLDVKADTPCREK